MSSRVLFVCSRNQWRSPTAERVARRRSGVATRSAGTAASARRRVNRGDLAWADLVLVMEDEHLRRLRADFPELIRDTATRCLQVPDDYGFMDPELVAIFERALDDLLDADGPA